MNPKPSRMIVCTTEAEWLAARRNILTASDVPVLLELVSDDAPWHRTPEQLFEEKVGLREPPSRDEMVSEWAYWGHRMEPILKEEYTKRTARALQDLGPYTIVLHPEFDFLGATLDMVAEHAHHSWGPVNIKTIGASQRSKWIKQDRKTKQVMRFTPEEKVAQVQTEIAVYGAKWGGLAGLIGGNTFETRDFPRDDAWIDGVMLPAVTKFMDEVKAFREVEKEIA